MIILGIDPGDPAGWAKYVGGEYDHSGITGGDDPSMARVLIQAVGPDILVIEDQFFRPGALKGIKTLLYRRYIWQIAAELEGIRVVVVEPSKWQGFFRLRKGKNSPKPVEQYGPLASALIGQEVSGDEAAAVCMAYWGAVSL